MWQSLMIERMIRFYIHTKLSAGTHPRLRDHEVAPKVNRLVVYGLFNFIERYISIFCLVYNNGKIRSCGK
jgi:hypothetical protein